MTITEFLLARIAEDEEVAGALPADGYYTDDGRVLEVPPDAAGSTWPRRWSPVRVLAECEAKRRIVEGWRASLERHIDTEQPVDGEDFYRGGEWGIDYALRALAAVYADHPDYREEWRP